MTSDHVAHNRAFWDADSDEYQAAHGDALARAPLAWGAYRIPERDLDVLGDVRDRDVLELGSGAAQWSIALEPLGVRPVGLDLSSAQLAHARRSSTTLPLTLASGEQLPFRNQTFDIVFCDHGALSFCVPDLAVAECARVLRPDGLLAFCCTHPLLYLTYNREQRRQTRRLQMTYEELGRLDLGEGTVDWALAPGTWISILREHGFDIEDLIELCAPPGATTTYDDFAPAKWARRWPAEWIWKARRRSSTSRGTTGRTR